ncbi:MAG: hypothetical protein II144_05320 [Paludibacteraceae bacterium]|nr:hypothetical protein [Paludibacteraceae bacterium]
MKRSFFLIVAGLVSATIAWAADGISYDGNKLTLNNEFTRTECGTMGKKTMKETSGLACSRRTPGYLWAHGDENTGDNRKIVAVRPDGTLTMTVKLTTPNTDRDDWEDICTGVYDNKNYLFVGAIGDNDLQFNDQYYIYYFEEPAISSGTITVTVNTICYGYPDQKAHNTETLMYDNVEQMFYIADKVDGVCHLYKLPFRTDYGTGVQRLTEVCALGNGDKFKLANGGDISPDGKCMAIKSEKYVLLWERQGSESLSATAQRLPQQVAAYVKEEQGESLAWYNDSIFYSTSDSKNDTPIYKYVRGNSSTTPVDTTHTDTIPAEPQKTPPALYEVIMSNSYSAYVDGTNLKAFYLAGGDAPAVDSYKVNEGTTWEQNGNTIMLTGTDSTTISYTLVTEPVTPVAFTADEIVFDGSEGSWVKCAYGWDSSKKWRFSKTDTDYSREIAGKTHVEFFLPACDTVVLKSMDGNERDMRVYANGVEIGSKTKLLKSGTTLVVNQKAPFMLSVVSAQSSGDGGVKALRMARKGNATDLGGIQPSAVSYQKILRDGQILIVRGDQTFTITGQLAR